MADRQRVRAGDRIQISAAAWNEVLSLVERSRGSTLGGPATFGDRSAEIILVRNTTEATVPRFGVLGLGGPMVDPVNNAAEFARQVAFQGIAPVEDERGRWCVAIEPIRPGKIGQAVIDGVVPVRLAAGEGDFVEPIAAETNYLQPGDNGTARILWRAADPIQSSDPPLRWAVIRLGDGTGGGASPQWGRVLSPVPDSEGAYLVERETRTRPAPGDPLEWLSLGLARYALANDDRPLLVDRRYLGTPAGQTAGDDLPLYLASGECCETDVPTPGEEDGEPCECWTEDDRPYYARFSGFTGDAAAQANICIRLTKLDWTEQDPIGRTICRWRGQCTFNDLPGQVVVSAELDCVYPDPATPSEVKARWYLTYRVAASGGAFAGQNSTYYIYELGGQDLDTCDDLTLTKTFDFNDRDPGVTDNAPASVTVARTPCVPCEPADESDPDECCPEEIEWCLDLTEELGPCGAAQAFSLAHDADCWWAASGADGWDIDWDPSIGWLEVSRDGAFRASYFAELPVDCDSPASLTLFEDTVADGCSWPETLTLELGACDDDPCPDPECATSTVFRLCFWAPGFPCLGVVTPGGLAITYGGCNSWTASTSEWIFELRPGFPASFTATLISDPTTTATYTGGLDCSGGSLTLSTSAGSCGSWPSDVVIITGACP